MTEVELLESELRALEIRRRNIEFRLQYVKNAAAYPGPVYLEVGRYPSLQITQEAAVLALEQTLRTWTVEIQGVEQRLADKKLEATAGALMEAIAS